MKMPQQNLVYFMWHFYNVNQLNNVIYHDKNKNELKTFFGSKREGKLHFKGGLEKKYNLSSLQ